MTSLIAERLDALLHVKSVAVSSHTVATQEDGAPLFDVADFVSEGLDVLTLDQLRDHLSKRLDSARGDLVGAINNDYHQFVSLSSQLDGMDASLLHLRRPLVEAAERLGEVTAAIEARKREVAATAAASSALNRTANALEEFNDAAEEAQAAVSLAARVLSSRPFSGPASSGVALQRGGGTGHGEGGAPASNHHGGRGGGSRARRAAPETAAAGAGEGAAVSSSLSSSSAASQHHQQQQQLGSALQLQRAAALCAKASRTVAAAQATLQASLGEAAAAGSGAGRASTSGSGLPSAAATAAAPSLSSAPPSVLLVPLSESLRASSAELHSSQNQLGAALGLALRGALEELLAAAAAPQSAPKPQTPAPASAAPVGELVPRVHALFCGLSSLGRAAEAEEAVCARVTRPLFSPLLTPGRVDDGLRGSFRAFGRMAEEALAGVAGERAPFGALLAAARGVPDLDLISACAWAPLLAVLNAQLPGWSSPAIPAVFAANYGVVSTLLSRLRVFAAGHSVARRATPAAGEGQGQSDGLGGLTLVPASSLLLSSPPSMALRAALAPKLSVYLALRSGEASGRLETALAGTRVRGADAGALGLPLSPGAPLPPIPQPQQLQQAQQPPALVLSLGELRGSLPPESVHLADAALLALLSGNPNGHGSAALPLPAGSRVTLRLPASAALWAGLLTLWTPPVMLPALAPALFSLTLAAVGRFGAWAAVGAAVGVHRASGAASAAGVGGPSAASTPLLDHISAALQLAGGGRGPVPASSTAAAAAQPGLPALRSLPPQWIRDLGAALAAAGQASAAAAASASAAAKASVPRPGTVAVPATAPVPVPSTAPLPPCTSDASAWWDAPLEAHLALACDLGALQTLLLRVLLPRLAAALHLGGSAGLTDATSPTQPHGSEPIPLSPIAAAASGLWDACEPLLSLVPYHLSLLRAALVRATLPGLAGFKAVPATHRLQTQQAAAASAVGGHGAGAGAAPPSRPSAYTPLVAKPLRLALAAAAKAGLLPGAAAEAQSAAVVLGVAADVTSALGAQLEAVLASLAHMEQSLAWLKKPPPTAAGAATGEGALPSHAAAAAGGAPTLPTALSDAERIGTQLLLDVRAVGRDLGEELKGILHPGGSAAETEAAAVALLGLPPCPDSPGLPPSLATGSAAVDALPGYAACLTRLAAYRQFVV